MTHEQQREMVLSELFTLAAGEAFDALLADAEDRGRAEYRAEVTRLEAEISAIDRALGIPPGREPRRLELLAKLRGHFCAPCGGTGFYQGPRLGDEKCRECDGFGIPKRTQAEAPTVASAELDSELLADDVKVVASELKHWGCTLGLQCFARIAAALGVKP